jgi:hypothetical protein
MSAKGLVPQSAAMTALAANTAHFLPKQRATPQQGNERLPMRRRESDLLWLQDMLEHLASSQQQLEWTQDPSAIHYLTESMLRDLDYCRRLCLNLNRRAALQTVN